MPELAIVIPALLVLAAIGFLCLRHGERAMFIPLDIPPGLNSDDTTFAAEGRWADGNNVRFWRGKPQVIGNATPMFTLAGGTRCNAITVFRIANGNLKWVFGTTSILYGADEGDDTPDDISPVGLAGSITSWSMAPWGATLLVCPQRSGTGGTLYQWTPGSAASEITQAPDQITYMAVDQVRRQVIAFGCNEVGGTFNGLCIRGADFESLTNWTPSSTNNSFEDILEGGTRIIAAAPVGPYWAVWTDTALFMGTFVGDPSQTWRWERIADIGGLAGPDAFTVVNGVAYWAGSDHIVMRWTPGTAPEPIPCPIRQEFATNQSYVLTAPRTTIVHHVPLFEEIWIHYADTRDATGQNSRYIAFSLRDGAWFRGQLARSAVLESTYYRANVLPSIAAYLAAGGLVVYGQETTATTGISYSWHIQSADQYIDESQRRMMIRGFIPDFEDQDENVSLTLYSRDRPQSSATTHGPYTLTTATTKSDFRASGKIFAVKLSGSVSALDGGYMRLGKPLFDAVVQGER